MKNNWGKNSCLYSTFSHHHLPHFWCSIHIFRVDKCSLTSKVQAHSHRSGESTIVLVSLYQVYSEPICCTRCLAAHGTTTWGRHSASLSKKATRKGSNATVPGLLLTSINSLTILVRSLMQPKALQMCGEIIRLQLTI